MTETRCVCRIQNSVFWDAFPALVARVVDGAFRRGCFVVHIIGMTPYVSGVATVHVGSCVTYHCVTQPVTQWDGMDVDNDNRISLSSRSKSATSSYNDIFPKTPHLLTPYFTPFLPSLLPIFTPFFLYFLIDTWRGSRVRSIKMILDLLIHRLKPRQNAAFTFQIKPPGPHIRCNITTHFRRIIHDVCWLKILYQSKSSTSFITNHRGNGAIGDTSVGRPFLTSQNRRLIFSTS